MNESLCKLRERIGAVDETSNEIASLRQRVVKSLAEKDKEIVELSNQLDRSKAQLDQAHQEGRAIYCPFRNLMRWRRS